MSRNKICILPKLNNCGGDVKKQWFIYYSFRNPADNKMVRFKVYDGFTDKTTKKAKLAHAQSMIDDYTQRLNSGWNPFETDRKGAIYEDSLSYAAVARVYKSARNDNRTFNFYSNQFLPEVQGMAEKTYKNYVSKFRIFDAWLTVKGYGGNDIATITPQHMRAFFLYLINDLKLARITVKKYEHMLDRMFSWCVKNKFIRQSPVIDLPETTRRNDQAPRIVNEADIGILVEKIKTDPQLWLTIQLEYYCFLRPGLEIRFARVGWFDMARGVINVPAEVVKTENAKTVIIPDVFRESLMNDWKLHLLPATYFVIGKNGIPGPEPLGSNNLRNRFNIIRDRLELPKTYKLYSWKHTGNARLADAGVPMYYRQMQNGHLSMRSTEEYLKNKIGFKSDEIQKHFPQLDE